MMDSCSLWYKSKLKNMVYMLTYTHTLVARCSGLKNKNSVCCWERDVAGGSGKDLEKRGWDQNTI